MWDPAENTLYFFLIYKKLSYLSARAKLIIHLKAFRSMKHKTLALLAGFLLISGLAFAQPVQGSVLLGGTAGFNSSSFGDANTTTIHFQPLFGYFIADQFAIGASANATFFGGDADGSSFGIGPFVRYYFNNSGNARFFGQAGISYNSTDPGDNFDSFSSFGFGVAAGVDLFLNSNVALEASLGFSSSKLEDADESTTNIGLNIGVAAFLHPGE